MTVGTSGTGGGFEKFCAGETDISDASRSIKDEEKAICEEKGIEFTEIQVANDALTIVVSKENDWIDCMTDRQLKTIWDQGSKVNSWKDVDPKLPEREAEALRTRHRLRHVRLLHRRDQRQGRGQPEDYYAAEDDNVS